MDFLGIKKRKAEKARKLQEAQQLKETETKIKIRKTLNAMKSQSAKLDTFKKEYIDKARKAALINSKQNYNFAKKGLKLCLSKQRYLDSMISNFEIALQMNEMNKVVNEFISGMNEIAKDMESITSNIDINRAQMAYQKALANNETQYGALDAFLKEAEESIEAFAGNEDDISEDEIDKLINNQAVDSETDLDFQIDSKINAIRTRVNG